MTNDEINNLAYMDVLEERGPSLATNEQYMQKYRFWYQFGSEHKRDVDDGYNF